MDVNQRQILFTFYMGKSVGSRFGQMVRKNPGLATEKRSRKLGTGIKDDF